MTKGKNYQIQMQALVNKAVAADIEILEQYQDKRALLELSNDSCAYSALLSKRGIDFVYLTDLKKYDTGFDTLTEEDAAFFELNRTSIKQFPNRTVRKTDIEQICLEEDIIKKLPK